MKTNLTQDLSGELNCNFQKSQMKSPKAFYIDDRLNSKETREKNVPNQTKKFTFPFKLQVGNWVLNVTPANQYCIWWMHKKTLG